MPRTRTYLPFMFEVTHNLSALGERLFAEHRHMPLAGTIRQAVRYHSLRTDLIMAEESCHALIDLERLPSGELDKHGAIVAYALLTTAIGLYARATKTSSKQRDPSNLLHRFTSEERVVHEELVGLRDEAIAHYGDGGSYSGEWKAEVAFIHTQGEDSKAGVVTRRITLDKPLVTRIEAQLRLTRSMVEEIYHEKLGDLMTALNEVLANDPDFHLEIKKHPLNLDVFMKSKSAADNARASFTTGYAMGVVDHG